MRASSMRALTKRSAWRTLRADRPAPNPRDQRMRVLPRLACVVALLVATGQQTHAAEPRLAAALQPFVDDHKLAGAVVLVASPERTLDLEAVGYSDVAAKTPMRPDDLFWIASMSKPMTASALMMLVDEGKVRLDDPVEKYLPEFRDQMVVGREGGRPPRPEAAGPPDHGPRGPLAHERARRSLALEEYARRAPPADRRGQLRHDAAPVRAGLEVRILATPASTRLAGSSRSSRACPTKSSCRSASSTRSA